MVNSLKLSGLLYFIGVLELLFGMMIAEFTYPNYSVSQNYISDLGATCRAVCQVYQPSSAIFNSSLLFVAIFVVAATYFLWISKLKRGKVLSIFLWVAGLAAAGVGLFPETAGSIHSIFSAIVFISMGIAAISAAFVIRQPLKILSAMLGLLTLGFTFLFLGRVYLGLGPGGAERFIVYPVLFWALAFSGYLMASDKTD